MAVTKLIQTMISGATSFGISLLSAANQAAAQTLLGIIAPVYGVWTPGLTVNNSATGITYSNQTGFYFRLGRVIVTFGRITLSNKGASSGTVRLTGLPIANDSSFQLYPVVIHNYSSMASISGQVSGLLDSGGGTDAVLYQGGATGSTLINQGNITNTSDLRFFTIYMTA